MAAKRRLRIKRRPRSKEKKSLFNFRQPDFDAPERGLEALPLPDITDIKYGLRDKLHEYKEQRKNGVRRRKRRKFNLRTFIKLHKSLVIIFAMLCVLALAALGGAIYVYKTYTVTNIYVDGNTHYSDEEIVEMVMTGRLSHNSAYLAIKYRDKSITDIPFIEKMDITILSPDTIRINVYEKAIAGYIEYLGRYMYFDREGIIVESSKTSLNDVPKVMGLDFNYVVMYEKLPVENEEVFEEILDITQLLSKYDLEAEKILFDSEYNVYLYFGDVEVSIGTDENIDEKIINLQYILPKLEGKKGILNMQEYSDSTDNVTFEEKN
jgi:cell division protein FtsQ